MAIYQPSATTGPISGALGGAVYVNSRGSKVVRHRPLKGPGIEPEAVNGYGRPAARLATITRYWRTLTALQRQAWNAAANQRTYPNRLGEGRNLSGFQLFVKYNMLVWWPLVDINPIGDPPIDGTSPPPALVTPTIETGSTKEITIDAGDLVTTYRFYVYAAVLYRDTVTKNQPRLKFLGVKAVNFDPETVDIEAQWDARMPPAQLGMVVWVGGFALETGKWPSSNVAFAKTVIA